VIAPFSMLLVGGCLLTVAAVGPPDALWVRVLSLLPPFAPILIPVRIALGHRAVWETAVAVVLLILAVLVIVRLGARVHAAGVMRSAPRIGWRAALRARP